MHCANYDLCFDIIKMFIKIQTDKINKWTDTQNKYQKLKWLSVQLGSQLFWNLSRDLDQSELGAIWIALCTEFIYMQDLFKDGAKKISQQSNLGKRPNFWKH